MNGLNTARGDFVPVGMEYYRRGRFCSRRKVAGGGGKSRGRKCSATPAFNSPKNIITLLSTAFVSVFIVVISFKQCLLQSLMIYSRNECVCVNRSDVVLTENSTQNQPNCALQMYAVLRKKHLLLFSCITLRKSSKFE